MAQANRHGGTKVRRHGALFVAFLALAVASSFVRAEAPIGPDEGRPRVSWEDANRVVGRLAFVSGKVAQVRPTQRYIFLDFDSKNKAAFVALIPKDKAGAFSESPETLYKDKIVRIRGFINTYQGTPQITIQSPSQVEVLSELPATKAPPKYELKPKDEITVAAYNVLNLFDEYDDPYCIDETTPAKPRDQLEHLAKTIREVNADVISFEEVENRGILERFIEVFLPDMGYEHVVLFEGNEIRGIDVAIVSRLPVGTIASNREREFPDGSGGMIKFERDLLQVQIEPPNGKSFEIWPVHLKSNYEGREYAEPIRKAEAVEVRRQLDAKLKANPNARIIVCGDFNDTPDSAAMKIIMGSGDAAMKSFHEELPPEKRVTYNQKPYDTSMIDFILASPGMAGGYVNGSFRILPGSPDTSGSDHNPISVKFKVGG